MNKDTFAEITANKKWASIDELTKALKQGGWFTDNFIDNAVESAMKAKVRSEINKRKDADGMPHFVSIVTPDGERIYKQESLFNLDDYKQTITYHQERGQHHINVAKQYRDRAFKRFRVNIQLTFDFADKAETVKK